MVTERCSGCGGDAGDNWFDRSLCPCDDTMHTRCRVCGTALDGCSYDDLVSGPGPTITSEMRERSDALEAFPRTELPGTPLPVHASAANPSLSAAANTERSDTESLGCESGNASTGADDDA
jgi:hypothetical protein